MFIPKRIIFEKNALNYEMGKIFMKNLRIKLKL